MQARASSRPPPAVPRGAILGVVALAGLALGLAFLAVGLQRATSLLLGMAFLVPALLNLPLAVVLWAPFSFLPPLEFVGVAPTAAAVAILLAWLPAMRDRAGAIRAALRLHAPLLATAGLLLGWVTVSLSWATAPDSGASTVWQWWFAGAAFAIAVSSVTTARHLRMLVVALVAGAVGSAVIGFAGESLASSASALELAAEDRRRLGSFLDDPNYVAAGLVAAIVLATGLVSRGRPVVNGALMAAVVLLAAAFAATESRGALVAAAVAAVAALVLYTGRRSQVLLFFAAAVGVAAFFFATTPDAWERVSEFDSTGSGRSSLWKVAWRITEDHPVAGVGLGNFVEEAPGYTRQPGQLEVVRNVAERPHVTHNVYLQFLAETGFVGVSLFVALVLSCMRAGWRAALVFDRKGDRDMAALARACLVALIAFAAASAFISNGNDVRLWLLLALGPIAYGVALRAPATSTVAPTRSRLTRSPRRAVRAASLRN